MRLSAICGRCGRVGCGAQCAGQRAEARRPGRTELRRSMRQRLDAVIPREVRRRTYGTARWKRMSEQLRAQHPVCQLCHRAPSDEAHHVDGWAPDPARFWAAVENYTEAKPTILAVCTRCHRQESIKATRPEKGSPP